MRAISADARANKLLATMLAGAILSAGSVSAQRERAADAESPREAAPIDVTGYWVSIVSEDWRFRMSMAQKGDWDIVPLNAQGQRVAESADLTSDPCMAYGAGGIMRVPGHLHVTWEDATTLRVDADAGMQTRLFRFDGSGVGSRQRTRQGYSVAEWNAPEPSPEVGGRVSPGGELRVVTTRLRPGYYFKHGVPYSEQMTLTEYFALLSETNGDEYLLVTSIADDPRYLRQQFVRTLIFKREADRSDWNPKPCTVP